MGRYHRKFRKYKGMNPFFERFTKTKKCIEGEMLLAKKTQIRLLDMIRS